MSVGEVVIYLLEKTLQRVLNVRRPIIESSLLRTKLNEDR